MYEPYSPAADVVVIPSSFHIPGLGHLAINAFLLRAKEPILVDTGYVRESDAFMDTLRSVVDPAELRWIYVSHCDADHIGSLHRLLAEVPELRVVTSFLTVGKLGLSQPLPMERVHLVSPGDSLELGDRRIRVLRPPAYDSPETTGFVDTRTRALFTSDCFGALLPTPPGDSADDLSEEVLRRGQTLWASIEAPWLHKVDRTVYADELDGLVQIEPRVVLSSHLPAASGRMIRRLTETAAAVPRSLPFVAPTQQSLTELLAAA